LILPGQLPASQVPGGKELQDSLRSGWQRHDVETEELRVALLQYRIFCNRLEELSRSD